MRSFGLAALAALAAPVAAYRVPISDNDDYREICSGMYGGDDAFIEVAFDDSSSGQVALVIYEWKDIGYLGAEQAEDSLAPKQYICTSKAVSAGQCQLKQLGGFITTLPTFVESSIYTTPLRFGSGGSSASVQVGTDGHVIAPGSGDHDDDDGLRRRALRFDRGTLLSRQAGGENVGGTTHKLPGSHSSPEPEPDHKIVTQEGEPVHSEAGEGWTSGDTAPEDHKIVTQEGDPVHSEAGEDDEHKIVDSDGDAAHTEAPHGGEVDDNPNVDGPEASSSAAAAAAEATEDTKGGTSGTDNTKKPAPAETEPDTSDKPDTVDEEKEPVKPPTPGSAAQVEGNVKTYDEPIHYKVPKTGYYCVGVVPVTLVKGDQAEQHERRTQNQRGSYQGVVTFRNQFQGELPAAEYPKIAFYGFLSVVYFLLACGWGFLCYRHYRELLPMQWYISGTIVFLVIEMVALFGYYRYINKHGGGAGSLAFLIVTAVLNAGRTTLSFFLLLIVCMGLSVVTQSLGTVMYRVWVLTAFHFIFGVVYSVGTVKIALDTASLWAVLFMIFPLSVTLTTFMMWIIVALNNTILFLKERKQHFKLAMFERLWRILIGAVIAIAVFFVLSSISLSNRMDDDYQPNHWKWRWVLLDASLATIYLVVFALIAWLWRPTEHNVRFSTSQELAQDEDDAQDYEIESYERRPEALGLQPISSRDPQTLGGEVPLRARDEFAHDASEGKALFDADRGSDDGSASDSDSDGGAGFKKHKHNHKHKHTESYRRVDASGRPVAELGAGAGAGAGASASASSSRTRVQEDSAIFSMGDSSDDEVRSAVSIDLSDDEGLLKSKRD